MREKPESYVGYFRPHIGKVLVAFCISALASAATFMATDTLSKFVDVITHIESLGPLVVLVAIWFGYEFVNKFFTFISSRILVSVATNVRHQIKWRICGKLANASVKSVGQNAPAGLAENASEDVNRFVDSIHGIYQEVFSVAIGIAALIYSAVISWKIFVMFLISFSILLVVHYLMKKNMVTSQSEARASTMNTKNLLLQIIQAFADIQAQSLTQGIKHHLSAAMNKEKQENMQADKVFVDSALISGTLSIVSQGAFLLLAAVLVLNTELTVANFVALYLYRHYIYGLADASLRIVKYKAQLDTARKRMDSIFRYKAVSQEVWGHTKLHDPTGKVSFKNVSAFYGENKALDDISVELPAGSVIGIVGESGCGKSTMMKVLDKEVSYSGSILLDGIELSSLDEKSHRKSIALAPQQPFLFDFSIKENMLLANPKASDNQIWDCLKECAADKFVRQKGGLDTMLTPKELSGGQRQRLALARLSLRGGKIILMDESTSALDGESQAIVMQTVQEAAARGHTMVLVAHRVSTLKNADKILLMDKGRIIAEGTYSELYEKSEKFRRLANLG